MMSRQLVNIEDGSPRHLWRGDVGISPVHQVEIDCDSQPRHDQEEKQSSYNVEQQRYQHDAHTVYTRLQQIASELHL